VKILQEDLFLPSVSARNTLINVAW